MPALDGTGPQGRGQLTGRGLGPCERGLAQGQGYGRGYGRRLGWRYRYPELELTKEEQKKILEAEMEELEVELKRIKDKLSELKNAKT